jgi:hypothetical protein
MTPEQEAAAVRRIGEAVQTAVMAEFARGTCPLLILRSVATQTGALAQGLTTGCGANPEAVHSILDRSITLGMHGTPRLEAKAS